MSNQEKFNKRAKADSNRKEEFKGTDGIVGYIYSWSGNKKAGEGQKEIKNIVEGKRIETEMRFVKPMAATTAVIMETESSSRNQTKVSLTNGGTLKYPLNILILMAEKNFANDTHISLRTLKKILEE